MKAQKYNSWMPSAIEMSSFKFEGPPNARSALFSIHLAITLEERGKNLVRKWCNIAKSNGQN